MAPASYSAPAKILHWLTAVCVLCGVTLGITMLNMQPGPSQNQVFDLHRSFGATILFLTGLRLIWRLYSPPPPLVADLPIWQEHAARITHGALYFLLFAVPLVGWTGTSAFGAPIVVFGLFELPDLVEPNKELATLLLNTHMTLAFILCGLVALHIAAALQHHFVRKDETLRRMLPGS